MLPILSSTISILAVRSALWNALLASTEEMDTPMCARCVLQNVGVASKHQPIAHRPINVPSATFSIDLPTAAFKLALLVTMPTSRLRHANFVQEDAVVANREIC